MEFITRLTNFIQSTVSEQLKSELSPNAELQSPPVTNTGIANTLDQFETAAPANNFLAIPNQKPEPPKTQAPYNDSKVHQLQERLKSLQDQRNDLLSQIKIIREEILQAEQAGDMPRRTAAQAQLKQLNLQLQGVEQEIVSVINEIQMIEQNEAQSKDTSGYPSESQMINYSDSLKQYFWNRLNSELLVSRHSFISSKKDD